MSRPRFLADHDLNGRIIAGLLRREPSVVLQRLRDVLPVNTPDDGFSPMPPSTGYFSFHTMRTP